MSTIIDDRNAYINNPFYKENKTGDFEAFYIAIAVCSVIGGLLFILNIVCCCCSRHSEYWQDRHTGNRWLVSIWSATPHKQPPLDYTELEAGVAKVKSLYPTPPPDSEFELKKRESEI